MLEHCPKLVTPILVDILELSLDTFILEVSKINFKDKLPCGCHWLKHYRPYRNGKKIAASSFNGLLVITIRTRWCKQLLATYKILHERIPVSSKPEYQSQFSKYWCWSLKFIVYPKYIHIYGLENLGFKHSLFTCELSFINLTNKGDRMSFFIKS